MDQVAPMATSISCFRIPHALYLYLPGFYIFELLLLLLLLKFCGESIHLTYCIRILCPNLRNFSYPEVAAILTALSYIPAVSF